MDKFQIKQTPNSESMVEKHFDGFDFVARGNSWFAENRGRSVYIHQPDEKGWRLIEGEDEEAGLRWGESGKFSKKTSAEENEVFLFATAWLKGERWHKF